MTADRDIVVVHTSDVHVDHEYSARQNNGDGAKPLAVVLKAARELRADMVLLCGDTFDCHNIPVALAQRVADMVRAAEIPVVLLPGNHDPAIDEAIWTPGGLTAVENMHILGVTHDEAVVFERLGLEVWGRPHRDYGIRAAASRALAYRHRPWPLRPRAGPHQTAARLVADRR